MPDRLTFLGTSDGLPSPDRYHASLLFRLAGKTILLDCGEPCSHTLKRMGIDFDSIDAVIITHTHSDHVAGFPMLLQSMWLEKRKRPLPVWMPSHAIAPLQRWLEACYLVPEKYKFALRWHPLTTRSRIRVGDVRIRPYRTTHLDHTRDQVGARYPHVQFDAHSLLIETGTKRIAYSADLGAPEDLAPLLAKPVHLLVTELAHFHPKILFESLAPHDIARIAVTHVGRPARARIQEVRRLARKVLPHCKVYFVQDGDTLHL